MKKLKVLLADPRHKTVGAHSYFVPIGIGYIGEFLRAEIKKDANVELKLATNPEEIFTLLKDWKPDIIGLSNYVGNSSLSNSICKYAKKINNRILTVVGGPNLPQDQENKLNFWRERHHFLDYRVSGEGEETFCDLLELIMSNSNIKKSDVKIPGLEFYDDISDTIFSGPPRERIKNIDETIPSPILEGYLDPFIHLQPELQGVRGCPYSCQFCHMSGKHFNKVDHNSIDRIIKEIEYVRKHNKTHNILYR